MVVSTFGFRRRAAVALLCAAVALGGAVVGSPHPAGAATTGWIEQLTMTTWGDRLESGSSILDMSPNARFVAFDAEASNVVDGDTNGVFDVFVLDRQLRTVERVSVAGDEAEANGASRQPSVSADGRFVAFRSAATNLVPGDTNGVEDAFVRDRQAGTTERVSVSSSGAQAVGDGVSGATELSDDGRVVVFHTGRSGLVPGAPDLSVYVRDRSAGTTTIANIDPSGTAISAPHYGHAVSGDGGTVAFAVGTRVLVRDLAAGTTELVTVDDGGNPVSVTNGGSPQLDHDGSVVVFTADSGALVPGDTNGVRDVFVRDRAARTTRRVNVGPGGVQADDRALGAVVSSDGSTVGFFSAASNLVAGDTNDAGDVFVHRLATGTTERVSTTVDGAQLNTSSHDPLLGADGRVVLFRSGSSLLDPTPGSPESDVYVRDPDAPRPSIIQLQPDRIGARADGTAVLNAFLLPGYGDPGTTVRYRVDGPGATTGSCMIGADRLCSFTLTGSGEAGTGHVRAFADGDGNGVQGAAEPTAYGSVIWYVDADAPTVDLRSPAQGVNYAKGTVVADYDCADAAGGSELVSCTGTLWITPTFSEEVPDGRWSDLDTQFGPAGERAFVVTARDAAGNTTTVRHEFTEGTATSTALVVDPTSAATREEVTQTATVSAGSAVATSAGGTVTFWDGTNPYGPVPLANGVATYTRSDFTAGTHQLRATYSGDPGFMPSATDTVELPVGTADTTPPSVDLVTPADGASYDQGQQVTVDYSCADTGGAGLTSCEGTQPDGALLDTSAVGSTTFTVTARDGDGNETVVTADVTIVRPTQVASRVQLSGTPNPTWGQAVTLTAFVPRASDRPVPTGTVVFKEGPQTLGTVALNASGVANLSVGTLSTGSHTYTADYSGDGEYLSSTGTGTVVSQGTDVSPPSIRITAPANGAFYTVGQSVTVAYSCTEPPEESGVRTCGAGRSTTPSLSSPQPLANGQQLNTSTAGTFYAFGFAEDAAGNQGFVGYFPYTVVAPANTTSQTVPAGGSTSTAQSAGQNPADPVGTTVVSPVAGTVAISEGTVTQSEPTGYDFFGTQVNITAPTSADSNPLVFTFDVDASLLPAGVDASDLQVFRNGVPLLLCTAPVVASPDPCIAERIPAPAGGGDVRIVVRTSAASRWNVGTATNAPPTANAGPDKTVKKTVGFDLDGRGSSDPQSEPLQYQWVQLSGPPAVIESPRSALTRVRPIGQTGTVVVKLIVTDPHGLQDSDTVTVTSTK